MVSSDTIFRITAGCAAPRRFIVSRPWRTTYSMLLRVNKCERRGLPAPKDDSARAGLPVKSGGVVCV